MIQMELKVRPFKPNDVNKGFNETLSILSPTCLTEAKARRWLDERKRSGVYTLVVEAEGEIVGTGSIWIERKLCRDGGKAGHIEDVAVHPDWQGQGIGKLVVNKLIEVAERAKAYKILLSCTDLNVNFYRRMGFVPDCYSLRRDVI